MDVRTSFLSGFLKQEIYKAQPDVLGKDDLVYKFLKSIYGLKQASVSGTKRCLLFYVGFHKLIKDCCVFLLIVNGVYFYSAGAFNSSMPESGQPVTEAEKDAMKVFQYREAISNIVYVWWVPCQIKLNNALPQMRRD
ncbi:LOW QUALITY PROTEIN: reverse transcriptase [Phytophthora megakarya]|uniref:Reverse transcriptase n=1 Tax=Phytophthora megakarya TaxID=4795 RepID=A0A225WL62_9STRA|nr:LOW QUALITY PROTEIN: reverse transcriptase [Phytophthora megakarya]